MHQAGLHLYFMPGLSAGIADGPTAQQIEHRDTVSDHELFAQVDGVIDRELYTRSAPARTSPEAASRRPTSRRTCALGTIPGSWPRSSLLGRTIAMKDLVGGSRQ